MGEEPQRIPLRPSRKGFLQAANMPEELLGSHTRRHLQGRQEHAEERLLELFVRRGVDSKLGRSPRSPLAVFWQYLGPAPILSR